GLVTLLWALKNDGKEKPGFGDVVHALATGRTSVVVDPAFDRAFYKLAGYRPLGRRAVRIDILERLADLIRPALAWKAGTGARPDGAYDGQAFMVTPAMMSILGANADDMEEILKGLGYRAEPKPAAEVKARLDAQDEADRAAAEARLAAKEAEAVEADATAGLSAEEALPPADAAAAADPVPAGADTGDATQDSEAHVPDAASSEGEAERAAREGDAMEADATAGLSAEEASAPADATAPADAVPAEADTGDATQDSEAHVPDAAASEAEAELAAREAEAVEAD